MSSLYILYLQVGGLGHWGFRDIKGFKAFSGFRGLGV